MLRRGKEHNVSRCLLKIESIIVIKGDLSSPVTMFKLTPLQTEIKEVYAFYLFQFKGHLGFFYLPSFFTTNITNVAIFITAPFDIFQQSLPLTFVTILKNICFQIKNLIERQQSIFDRHETICIHTQWDDDRTVANLQFFKVPLTHKGKQNLPFNSPDLFFGIYHFRNACAVVQYAYLTFISTFKFLSSSFTKTKTVTRLCQPKTGEHIKFTTG